MSRHKLGIIGYGNIAKTHLKAIGHYHGPQSIELYAVLTRQAADSHQIFSHVYTTPESFFQDEGIEAVDICTPNAQHFSQAQQAIDTHKAIYMEKPIARSSLEAKPLVDQLNNSDLVAQVVLTNRFNPAVVLARDILASGGLGTLVNFKASYYHHSYISLDKLMSWRQSYQASGGGAIVDLGIHTLDLVRFLFGEVEGVKAYMSTVFKERYQDSSKQSMVQNDTDEYAAVLLKMKSDVLGFVDTSRISFEPKEVPLFTVYGTLGTLYLYAARVEWYDLKGNPVSPALSLESDFYRYLKAQQALFDPSLSIFELCHGLSMVSFLDRLDGLIDFKEIPDFNEAYQSQGIVDRVLHTD